MATLYTAYIHNDRIRKKKLQPGAFVVSPFVIFRVAAMMPFVMDLDMLLTVGASAILYRALKKTNDLFNMSKEILAVGRFSIVGVGETCSDQHWYCTTTRITRLCVEILHAVQYFV